MKKVLLLLLTAALALGVCWSASAAQEAIDITSECSFELCYTHRGAMYMTDRKYTSYWESQEVKHPFVTLTAPAGQPIYGVYVCFGNLPGEYEWQVEKDGEWVSAGVDVNTNFLHAYAAFPEGVTRVRLYVTDEKKKAMRINEIFAFSSGEIPDWVQRWEPTPSKADILFLATHPDDDLIFFGGAIPTYAVEQQRDVVVAYLTRSNSTRSSELLNGLWSMGVRQYPVIGSFRDNYPKTMEQAYKNAGGSSKVIGWIVELFRAYQPEVVVTQDENGEYGHPQHQMVADAAKQAYALSPTAQYEDSYNTYGPWRVKKLYLHLYPNDQITLDWSKPLQSMGGKTGFELAEEAFAYHVTQAKCGLDVTNTGVKYDNRVFGLYATQVGPDVRGDDFLENIYDAPASFVTAAPTPEPTPVLTPEPAYTSLMPALNASGYLDEGEFVYANDTDGLYIFVNQTCKVVVQRHHDDSQPLTWYDAEIWGDVASGELLKTIQYDPEKVEKVRVDASETAKKYNVAFAMNTDYYTYRLGSKNGRPIGLVIRDGQIRYEKPYTKATNNFPNLDTLAFYPDGSMDVHASYELTGQEYLDRGAYMVYSFGPYLIRDGVLNAHLEDVSTSRQPRCALGMIEPGHYVAIIAEGRLKDSNGVSVKQLALMMREKGCTVAYNLDGGQTAVFEFMGKQLNRIGVYDGKTSARKTCEILGIGTSEQVGNVEFK